MHNRYFGYLNKERKRLPEKYILHQNFPQSFVEASKISFDLQERSNVKLVIYDFFGKEVTKLIDNELLPGSYETKWTALNCKPGVYYYKLMAGDFVDSKKILLMEN